MSILDTIIPPEISDDEFYYLIRKLAAESHIKTILEIGSSAGGGSTEAFVSGLRDNPYHPHLFCMEVSMPRFAKLQQRYISESVVHCYNVSSVPLSRFPSEKEVELFYKWIPSALNNYPLERVIGWLRQDIEYVNASCVEQNGIPKIKQEHGITAFDMVLIDGSEFTGMAELDEVYGAEYILLANINSFKNRHNYQRLREDPSYSLLQENWTVRNGYAVFRKDMENTDPAQAMIGNIHPRCWCGGEVKPSVHPCYWICCSCETHIVKEKQDNTYFKEFYSLKGYWHDYQQSLSYPPITQRSYDDFGNRIKVWHQIMSRYNSKPEYLLEIGCAHGGFLEYSRQHGTANVVGVEVDEETCAYVRQRFGLDWVVSGLFPDVSLPFAKYDVICGFDVMEHFLDPVEGMRAVGRHLKENGISIFQTPCYRGEGAAWGQFKPEEHLFLFNSENIKRLFEAAGLDVLEIIPGYFPDDMFVVGCRQQNSNKHILIIRTDTIGDNVLFMPVLPHLRKKYPEAKITVCCQDTVSDLYSVSPYIDAVIPFNHFRAYADEHYREQIMESLRAVNADLAINAAYTRQLLNEYFTLGCGAGEKIAFDGDLCELSRETRDADNPLYSKLINSPGENKGELERNRDLLAGLDIAAPELEPQMWTTPEDVRFAESFFVDRQLEPAKTIALFVTGRHEGKQYPRYPDALGRICREQGYSVVAFGAPQDREVSALALDMPGVRTINLCGDLSLRQSAEIIRRCRCAVGADTGLSHIACAVGTPHVVVLWGGHFGRFFPYSPLATVVCLPLECYGCNWKCPYPRWHCVKDIDPRVIEFAVSETLDKRSTRSLVVCQHAALWDKPATDPAWMSCVAWLDTTKVSVVTPDEADFQRLSLKKNVA